MTMMTKVVMMRRLDVIHHQLTLHSTSRGRQYRFCTCYGRLMLTKLSGRGRGRAFKRATRIA